jgi:hypothetical protein
MRVDCRRFLAFILFVISLIMIFWSLWSFPKETRRLVFHPKDLQFISEAQNSMTQRAILETRQVYLEWPKKMRLGQVQSIQITFLPAEPDENENDWSEKVNSLADVFEFYTVMVEARLELPGLVFSPDGQISQLLLPDHPVSFVWNVKAEQALKYQGTAWLYLRFISKDDGEEHRQVLTAQLVQFEGIDFLGLDYLSTRLIGSLGLSIGIILSFDRFFVGLWSGLQTKKREQ